MYVWNIYYIKLLYKFVNPKNNEKTYEAFKKGYYEIARNAIEIHCMTREAEKVGRKTSGMNCDVMHVLAD